MARVRRRVLANIQRDTSDGNGAPPCSRQLFDLPARRARRRRCRSGRTRPSRRSRSTRWGSSRGTAGGSPRRSRTGARVVGGEFGRDRAVAGGREHLLVGVERLFGGGALVIAVVEDQRAVLGADVGALAHALRGVVPLPEQLQQVLVAGLGGVVGDEHDLGVAGAGAADLLVGGVGRRAAGVAHRGRVDAVGFPEDPLGAPEAAHAEDRGADSLREGRPQRRAEHGVAFGHGDCLLTSRQSVGRVDQSCLVPAEYAHELRLARLEHEHRDVARGALVVLVEARVLGVHRLPQPLALLAPATRARTSPCCRRSRRGRRGWP